MNPKLIYISSNDGTDMRINKEVRTLSIAYDVIFLGVNEDPATKAFLDSSCSEIHLIRGKRNHPVTLLKQILKFLIIFIGNRIHSIHIVNEQLMIFFWPFLFFKYTVLDVFDSLFMRHGIKKEQWSLIKKLVYAPCDKVLVTDSNRRSLMPDFLQHKVVVLPNYPFRYNGPLKRSSTKESLTVLFFGWLGMHRGGSIAQGLLESDERMHLIMLGWFADEGSKALAGHPRADYRGIIPQREALKIAATEADYILCLYEPRNNLNAINASPNKIYDGIQTQTPIIINREIKVASLVEELNIGVVLPSYYYQDFDLLAQKLIEKKDGFEFSSKLQESYTWEEVEHRLLNVHQV